MKYIYIVLIRAHTGLGAIARRITGYPYTHIAVSLDASLTDFISFSRRYHFFPFDAGFTHEYRDYYAFGKHKSFVAKVFQVPVSEDEYAEICCYIEKCEHNNRLVFNLFSMATMPLIGGFRIQDADNCMSFTAQVLTKCGAVKMKKNYWHYSIQDIDVLLHDYFYFEGKIKRISSKSYSSYMRPFSVSKYLKDAVHLFFILISRMLQAIR